MTVATAPMPTSTIDDRRSFDGPGADERRRGARTTRRGLPRIRTLKGAAIVVPAGSSIRCTLKNVSQTGACLRLQSAVFLSHSFTIVFDDPEWPRRACRVVWRDVLLMGVEFETAEKEGGPIWRAVQKLLTGKSTGA